MEALEMEDMAPRALLIEVTKAIRTILRGGQEYRIGTRSLRRADLKMLRDLRRDLQDELAEDGGDLLGNTKAAVFDRR